MEYTIEQKRAIALAKARKRKAEAEAKQQQPEKPQANDPAFWSQVSEKMDQLNESLLSTGPGRALSELAASANKSVFEMIDFLGVDNVNAVLDLVGSDKQLATAADTLGSDGGYMEDGLGKDIVQAAGQTLPVAAMSGQVLRDVAAKLPQVAAGESALVGTARQMGASKAGQDATAGLLSATGGELGEEVAGADGKLVGNVVAPMAALLPNAGKEMVKAGFRGNARNSKSIVNQAIDDFAEVNASPTLGQATGNELRQAIESRSAQVLGGGAIRKSIERTTQNMQARLASIADDISPVTGEVEAGNVIRKGIVGEHGFVSRFQDKSGQLWSKFDSLIDPNSAVAVQNTRAVLDDLVKESPVGQVFNNPLVSKVRDAVAQSDGVVDYRTFRELRSAIGAKLGSKDLISDIPRAELKQLYGALSQDLKQVAAQSGDDAIQALSRANNYTSAGHKRLDDFVERVTRKVDLDKVFEAMARGGEGIQSLNAMKRSLKPEEWEAVGANVIRRLGRANNHQQDTMGEVFSVGKFLTDWNKLGRSKDVLFSGSEKLNAYSNNLDKIARVSERVKESMQAGANPSGTGQLLANVGLSAGLVSGAVTGNYWAVAGLLATIGANKSAATLMTNQHFVKWLAQATTVKDLPAHIARLETIGNSAGISEEITELLGGLEQRADVDPAADN